VERYRDVSVTVRVSASILEARHGGQDVHEFKEDENAGYAAIGNLKRIQVRDASTLESSCLRRHAPGTRASWPGAEPTCPWHAGGHSPAGCCGQDQRTSQTNLQPPWPSRYPNTSLTRSPSHASSC
jgi:hypothetical protein